MASFGKQKQETSGHTDVRTDQTQYKQNFSTPKSQQMFDDYLGQAKDNFGRQTSNANSLNNKLSQMLNNGGVGDTSYFKQAWGQAQGIDQSNLNKMDTQDLNPYNDEVTRNFIDASNRAAYLANGRNVNQMMQNVIGSNMANGSGHQTAAAKVGANLAANINAQNQQTYLQRQNQLEQNALAANNQLGNFYNTLSNIGIDYARLNQQDLQTLLSAYQSSAGMMNDALNSYGRAVELGSDPTTTTNTHKYGEEAVGTTKSDPMGAAGGVFSALGGLGRIFGW